MFSWFKKKQPAALPFTTDIHCHIVPGIDDGSQSVDSSIELLQHMQQWGLTHIIPTPHVTEDTFENTPATIDPPYGELVAAATQAGITLQLHSPSAEYRIDGFFMQSLDNGIVRPLPGNYLLVENGFIQEPWDLDNRLYDLSIKGYRPILAHPERYAYYHNNFDRYRQLHSRGILLQCNLMSLGGYYGKDVKQIALKMLENDLIDFLGTDLHGMRHVQFIEDFLSTKQFERIASQLQGRLLNDTLLHND